MPPAHLGLDPFYQKYIDFQGIPVIAAAEVDDRALGIACRMAERMSWAYPAALPELVRANIRISIIGRNQQTLDIPEYHTLPPRTNADGSVFDYNTRTRGLGATRTRPVSSVGEENLLDLPWPHDRYWSENIMVHEWAHTFFMMGVARHDPSMTGRLRTLYDNVMRAGLYAGTYSAENMDEYFAVGAQLWWNVSTQEPRTRVGLQAYDPGLAQLLEELFSTEALDAPPPGTLVTPEPTACEYPCDWLNECFAGWQCVNGCEVNNSCGDEPGPMPGPMCEYPCGAADEGRCDRGWECVSGCEVFNGCGADEPVVPESPSTCESPCAAFDEGRCSDGWQCLRGCEVNNGCILEPPAPTCEHECADFGYAEGQCQDGFECVDGCVVDNGCTSPCVYTCASYGYFEGQCVEGHQCVGSCIVNNGC